MPRPGCCVVMSKLTNALLHTRHELFSEEHTHDNMRRMSYRSFLRVRSTGEVKNGSQFDCSWSDEKEKNIRMLYLGEYITTIS